MSVSVFSDLDGFLECRAHGGRDARHADRLQQRVQVVARSTRGGAHRLRVVVAGQAWTAPMKVSRSSLSGPTTASSLSLAPCATAFAPACAPFATS